MLNVTDTVAANSTALPPPLWGRAGRGVAQQTVFIVARQMFFVTLGVPVWHPPP